MTFILVSDFLAVKQNIYTHTINNLPDISFMAKEFLPPTADRPLSHRCSLHLCMAFVYMAATRIPPGWWNITSSPIQKFRCHKVKIAVAAAAGWNGQWPVAGHQCVFNGHWFQLLWDWQVIFPRILRGHLLNKLYLSDLFVYN